MNGIRRHWRQRCLRAGFHGLLRLAVTLQVFVFFALVDQTVEARVPSEEKTQAWPVTAAPTRGKVWLLTRDSERSPALQLETRVDIKVTGMLARTRLQQRFRNTSGSWAEGVYVFPLPVKATVDHFRLFVDGRVIEGQVKEKRQAAKTYRQARNQGRRAALLVRHRPNVFTTRLANIAPGAELQVEIEYQQVLDFRDGEYALQFPLLVAPRYITGAHSSGGERQSPLRTVSSAADTQARTAIHVRLDAGVPLQTLESPSHRIVSAQLATGRFDIELADGKVPLDRDFILRWKPLLTDQVQPVVLAGQDAARQYRLVMIYPPDERLFQASGQGSEKVFILDVSGSMSGQPIEQARQALFSAIRKLQPGDYFNLVWFSDQAQKLFVTSRVASARNKRIALARIAALEAGGGTEMRNALELALQADRLAALFGTENDTLLRQVIFITDGDVDNERELFRYIETHLGDRRLFTVGIGSAPNRFFMQQAARAGRGTATFIRDTAEVKQRIDTLLKKIALPALTDITPQVQGEQVEIYPGTPRDLYLAEPVSFVLSGQRLSDTLTVSGRLGERAWSASVDLGQAVAGNGIRQHWAAAKVDALMRYRYRAADEALKTDLKNRIVAISIEHHILTGFTGMVAVDVTPVNDQGVLFRETLRDTLPHGWRPRTVQAQTVLARTPLVISLPQTASGLDGFVMASLLCLSGWWLLRRLLAGRQHV